ncbi:MAG: hypothetical protein EBZ48_06395 [Proteobacteria bacterium]|nr:hypothetical protein [Pseudomonadota bacterium]
MPEQSKQDTIYTVGLEQAAVRRQYSVNPAMVDRIITLQEETVRAGRFPYVALLEHNGKVVAEAYNTVNLPRTIGDFPIWETPEQHPEMSLIINAGALARERYPNDHKAQLKFLSELTLYSSCEVCCMCAHAAAGARITNLVHTISREAAEAATKVDARDSTAPMTTQDIFAKFNLPVTIVGGVEQERALVAFKAGWAKVQEFFK